MARGGCHYPTVVPKRQALNTKINGVHDALGSRLPMEIVMKIFKEFLSDYKEQYLDPSISMKKQTTALLLGGVCRGWRLIAWSSPQLWDTICVNLYNGNLHLVQLVREWLDRSGSLPLYINIYAAGPLRLWKKIRRRLYPGFAPSEIIYFDYPLSGFYDKRSVALIDAINEHSARWKNLEVHVPRNRLRLVNSASASMLKTLALIPIDAEDSNNRGFMFSEIDQDTEVDEKNLIIAKSACVEKLCIERIQPPVDDMNWNNLKHFEAADVPTTMIYDCLHQSPV
ncbi:hypothetical protein BDN70DRAFT_939246 [Pholiota conissans]|uniref:F-box domain-containing protein n=1 Tax=Pholiota conissans TaxID=109636 RepID=A0A9P6CLE3_9AGAR|nr:hypothetical protein BDN70DRAFT_939246 [Pholiota conissans]